MSDIDDYKKDIPKDALPPQKTVIENIQALHPEQPKESYSPPSPSQEPEKVLWALLYATPFFYLFEHIANRLYPNTKKPRAVLRLRASSPTFYKFSIIADFILRALITCSIVFITLFTIYKILK